VNNAALKKMTAKAKKQEATLNINLSELLHDLSRKNRSLVSRLFN